MFHNVLQATSHTLRLILYALIIYKKINLFKFFFIFSSSLRDKPNGMQAEKNWFDIQSMRSENTWWWIQRFQMEKIWILWDCLQAHIFKVCRAKLSGHFRFKLKPEVDYTLDRGQSSYLTSSSFKLGKNDKNSANLSVSESELLFANETRLTIFKENPFKTAVFPVIGS